MSVVDNTANVTAEFHRRARQGMTVAGNVAEECAVELAPIDKGFLRKGIYVSDIVDDGKTLSMKLISPVEYSIPQELGPAPGSKRQFRFTPFIRPTNDFMQTKFQGIIEKAVLGK